MISGLSGKRYFLKENCDWNIENCFEVNEKRIRNAVWNELGAEGYNTLFGLPGGVQPPGTVSGRPGTRPGEGTTVFIEGIQYGPEY